MVAREQERQWKKAREGRMLETLLVPGWCWLVTLLAAALLPPGPFITNMAPYRDTRISTANKEIRSLENGNLSYTFS